jgi:hypothetical protein
MTAADLKLETRDIAVDEVFPHTAETIWKTLTTAELMGRWMMQPAGFEATESKVFTFQTTPAGTSARITVAEWSSGWRSERGSSRFGQAWIWPGAECRLGLISSIPCVGR